MSLLQKVKTVKADISVQLADLIVFVGYFGLCLYIGGVAYVSAFNDHFGISILRASGIIETALLFVDAANLGVLGYLILTLSIMALSFIFFLSRFVVRLYFGYAAIITIFCLSTFVASALGSQIGKTAASNSVNADESSLPTFKYSGQNGRYQDGSYKLLYDDGKNLYVTKLVAEGSLVQIDILLKSKIDTYEVTLK